MESGFLRSEIEISNSTCGENRRRGGGMSRTGRLRDNPASAAFGILPSEVLIEHLHLLPAVAPAKPLGIPKFIPADVGNDHK